MEQGYSICFNEWALDKDIKSELGLLVIISSLCAEKGYCFASNQYLAELFDISEVSVSRKINLLEEKGYINIEYEKRGCEVINRYIRLTKLLTDGYQKCYSTINKNVKENNISINNTNINNKKEEINKEEKEDTIYDFLQKNGFILSPLDYEVVGKWEDNSLTRHAIQEAVANGKISCKYVDAIIRNFKAKNIQTVSQAKDNSITFKKNKVIERINPNWLNEDIEENTATEEEQAEFERMLENIRKR